jgi:hypothetical protein
MVFPPELTGQQNVGNAKNENFFEKAVLHCGGQLFHVAQLSG